jgi:hypothetical protein
MIWKGMTRGGLIRRLLHEAIQLGDLRRIFGYNYFLTQFDEIVR